MHSTNPNHRIAFDPQPPEAALYHGSPPQFPMPLPVHSALSLNVFYQSQQTRLAKGNCRSIEVVLLFPLYAPRSPIAGHPTLPSSDAESLVGDLEFGDGSMAALEAAKMLAADQVRERDISLINGLSHENGTNPPSLVPVPKAPESFRFLDLPFELRLKIYGYILPPRTHTIVTQIPNNGYFYNTSTIPTNSATSFYPFGRSQPESGVGRYTTYKVLTTNFHTDFPCPSINPQLLLVSKQILAEAEPVLYGSRATTWDFGIHLDALLAFWNDRSEVARKCAKNIRIARKIPSHLSVEYHQGMDPLWDKACSFLTNQMPGLRTLDLTMWSSTSYSPPFPPATLRPALNANNLQPDLTPEEHHRQEQIQLANDWRDWQWTHDLLSMPALKQATVTWWAFKSLRGTNGAAGSQPENGFDSWIAGRMVGDRLVRERMVRDGVVVEGVVVMSGVGGDA